MTNTMDNHIERTENRTNVNLQKDSKTQTIQETKTL